MRIFGSDRMDGMLQKLGLKEDEAIIHPWINKAIEKAQQKVEARNFDIRKNILKYDNVMNDQRKVVFEQRKRVHGARRACATRSTTCATASSTTSSPAHIPRERLSRAVGRRGPEGGRRATSSTSSCRSTTGPRKRASPTRRCASACARPADEAYAERVEKNSPEVMTYVEKQVLLQIARPSLARAPRHPRPSAPGHRLARLRPARSAERVQVRGLRALQRARRPSARAGHRPAHADRGGVPAARARRSCRRCSPSTSIRRPARTSSACAQGSAASAAPARRSASRRRAAARHGGSQRDPNDPSTWGRVGRNEPCPCGSGKKYKHCHGRFG